MADKTVWVGMGEASQLAVLLELLLQTATPVAGTPFSAAVNTALDTLTAAQAQALLGSFNARQKRAQYGA